MMTGNRPTPLRLFKSLHLVLAEMYPHLPADSDEVRDVLIKNRMAELTRLYRRIVAGQVIRHDTPVNRWAYIQRYVATHAAMIDRIITLQPTLQTLFAQNNISIACVGAGPGTEILGVLKYLSARRLTPKIDCALYDRERNWESCWSVIRRHANVPERIRTECQFCDIGELLTWPDSDQIERLDLVCFAYVCSELFRGCVRAKAFFGHIFENARTGAVFLFVDFRDTRVSGWFDGIASAQGLVNLASVDLDYVIGHEEQKTELREFGSPRFTDPATTARLSYRLYRKEF